MSITLNSLILSVTRRSVKGFTVGEIYDRVTSRLLNSDVTPPPYNSVRARVYELASAGSLTARGHRADSVSGRTSTVFTRN